MTAPLSPPGDRRGVTWLDLLAVGVVTLLAFMPVLRTGFSPLDDYIMLQGNSDITHPTWDAFKSFWTQPSFRIYMPLALSIWQAIAVLTQSGAAGAADLTLTPLAFKIVSVATHVIAAMAAARTLSTLTRTRWPAVLGALVFALHPLQVEAVAWTTGLKDELCGLFSILAVGFYAGFAERDRPTPWGDAWWWATMGMAVLAMFSKPTAMVLPVILLAVDWVVRRRDVVRRFEAVGPFLLPAIACGLVIITVQHSAPVDRVPLPLRPLIATDSYAFYLAKLFWPARLAIDYGRRPGVVWHSGAVWWTWVVPAVALTGVLLMRSRRAVLAAVLFVVPILPVSGLVSFDMQQYSTVTDHYVYQSMLGVGLIVTLLAIRWPKPAGVAAVLACVAMTVTTRHVATKWQDLEGFYRSILVANPKSFLARDLLSNFAAGRGDLFSARRLVEDSLAENPDGGGTLDNLSTVYLLLGKYRESADAGLRAMQHLSVKRLSLARRVTLLGIRLKDLQTTETGLRYWRQIEPDNRFVLGMLRTVQEAKAREAAQPKATPGTGPTTGPLSTPATDRTGPARLSGPASRP